jgi:pilus assembly protein TadC
MTGVIILGLLAAGGLWMALTAVAPVRPTLAATIAAVTTVQPLAAPAATGRRWLPAPVIDALIRHGLPRRSVQVDLAICDREPGDFLATQILAALAGGLVPAAATGAIAAIFGSATWLIPVWALLIGAAIGATAVHLRLRSRAETRRTDMRAALSAVLDVTVVALSGGAGVEQALAVATAPRLGHSWALQRLHTAVTVATRAGTSIWEALADLGAATGVTQLRDLAAAIQLTGTEGAHIRDSLASRAETLRARQASDLKAAARSATQRMVIPLMVIGIGYLLFLIYPSITVLAAHL